MFSHNPQVATAHTSTVTPNESMSGSDGPSGTPTITSMTTPNTPMRESADPRNMPAFMEATSDPDDPPYQPQPLPDASSRYLDDPDRE